MGRESRRNGLTLVHLENSCWNGHDGVFTVRIPSCQPIISVKALKGNINFCVLKLCNAAFTFAAPVPLNLTGLLVSNVGFFPELLFLHPVLYYRVCLLSLLPTTLVVSLVVQVEQSIWCCVCVCLYRDNNFELNISYAGSSWPYLVQAQMLWSFVKIHGYRLKIFCFGSLWGDVFIDPHYDVKHFCQVVCGRAVSATSSEAF